MSAMDATTIRKIVLYVATVGFLVALIFPGFDYTKPGDFVYMPSFPGWALLVLGWIPMIFVQPAALAWLANPFFLVAIYKFYVRNYWSSMWVSGACILLAGSFFPICWLRPMLLVFTGAGETINHPRPNVGFIAWMAAFLIVFVFSKRLTSIKYGKN
jgi:hypothetical protein